MKNKQTNKQTAMKQQEKIQCLLMQTLEGGNNKIHNVHQPYAKTAISINPGQTDCQFHASSLLNARLKFYVQPREGMYK
jgi:hypothetical protein